ncbi:MAG: hypothetical protein H0T99_09460 [Geodermatophilaceae bacterium]|nr:hypothetical protein [Geodermatophilaceae bacterium]
MPGFADGRPVLPDERTEIAPLLVSELKRSLQFYVERLGAAVLKAG